RFSLEDKIEFAQVTTKQLQETLTPAEVVDFLRLGNERFRSGNRLIRDLGQQIQGTSTGQHPLAVILTCIDSRSPAELIFDLGLGDIFTVRIAGNVVRSKVLGSM
ncbi:MAG: carbonic anhydrase, partial [Pirellulaceae bacterium]